MCCFEVFIFWLIFVLDVFVFSFCLVIWVKISLSEGICFLYGLDCLCFVKYCSIVMRLCVLFFFIMFSLDNRNVFVFFKLLLLCCWGCVFCLVWLISWFRECWIVLIDCLSLICFFIFWRIVIILIWLIGLWIKYLMLSEYVFLIIFFVFIWEIIMILLEYVFWSWWIVLMLFFLGINRLINKILICLNCSICFFIWFLLFVLLVVFLRFLFLMICFKIDCIVWLLLVIKKCIVFGLFFLN